jgi:DNA-3-methyladenine glycosylase II
MAVPAFSMTPRGVFDLARQSRHFGGWPAFPPDPDAVAMTFPVEGWAASATVLLRQPDAESVTGSVHGTTDAKPAERAWRQALSVLSLDVDGRGFADVGERDPVIGELQRTCGPLRPTLFHSPYEAACSFVIGQRISIAQARAIRGRVAATDGDHVVVGGVDMTAFPRPQVLLGIDGVEGLSEEKLRRLHAVARAALDGVLDRERLRALPVPTALEELTAIHGVGPFSAQGILHRGAGVVDDITDDPVSKEAVQRLYGLDHLPDQDEVLQLAESWRPYRMWATVLMHVWIRGDGGGPTRSARGNRRPTLR